MARVYFEFRLAESQRSIDTAPTWYTVRVMKDDNPLLDKGDFVKVTAKLKADFYLNREGKPTGTLLITAFEASKIAKQVALQEGAESGAPAAPREAAKEKLPTAQQVRPQERAPEKAQVQAQERLQATEPQQEPDWPTLYS